MRVLVDTQLILWAAAEPHRVPRTAAAVMNGEENELHFSVVSLWEVTIKNGAGRTDFRIDTRRLRERLLRSSYTELTVTAEHTLVVLPAFHKDPFDRILVAQAAVEQLVLLTADKRLGQYSDRTSIRLV